MESSKMTKDKNVKKNNVKKNKVSKKNTNALKKNKLKKIIIIILVIFIVYFGIIAVINISKNKNKMEIKTAKNEMDMENTENVEIVDNKKINNVEEMKMPKIVGDLEYNLKSLESQNNECKIVFEVTNMGDEDFKGKDVKFVFYEKEGRRFGEVESYVGDLAINETIEVIATTTLDVSNAYNYNIEENRLLEENI